MLGASSLSVKLAGESLETFRHFPRRIRSAQAVCQILRLRRDRDHSDRARLARYRNPQQLRLIVVFFAISPITFQRYSQSVGDPIDVGVIGDNLSDVQYRPITEAASA